MLDTTCPTTQHFLQLSTQELVAKLVALEEIVFNLHLDISGNEDYENMSKATEIALTKVNNDLYAVLHNKTLV